MKNSLLKTLSVILMLAFILPLATGATTIQERKCAQAECVDCIQEAFIYVLDDIILDEFIFKLNNGEIDPIISVEIFQIDMGSDYILQYDEVDLFVANLNDPDSDVTPFVVGWIQGCSNFISHNWTNWSMWFEVKTTHRRGGICIATVRRERRCQRTHCKMIQAEEIFVKTNCPC